MTRIRDGWCGAYGYDSYIYKLHPGEHHRLLVDWMGGKAFFEGLGIYGERVALKLPRIEAVTLWTKLQVDDVRADEFQMERDDEAVRRKEFSL